jgi:hypothetical protein
VSKPGYQLYLDVLGARRLFGVPAEELANRLIVLEDSLGAFVADLAERLADARDTESRHCSRAASAQDPPFGALGRSHPRWSTRSSARATRGAAHVESLGPEVGWSRRHVAARFARR